MNDDHMNVHVLLSIHVNQVFSPLREQSIFSKIWEIELFIDRFE